MSRICFCLLQQLAQSFLFSQEEFTGYTPVESCPIASRRKENTAKHCFFARKAVPLVKLTALLHPEGPRRFFWDLRVKLRVGWVVLEHTLTSVDKFKVSACLFAYRFSFTPDTGCCVQIQQFPIRHKYEYETLSSLKQRYPCFAGYLPRSNREHMPMFRSTHVFGVHTVEQRSQPIFQNEHLSVATAVIWTPYDRRKLLSYF